MSRTYKTLIVAAVAVLAVGGYWKVVLSPKRAQAADLAAQVDQQNLQLAQTQSLIKTYQDAQGAYHKNVTTVVRLGKAVPGDDDTRSLVVQLDAAAKRSGVTFDNVDVGTGASSTAGATATTATSGATKVPPGAVDAGSYAVMPFTLAFDGDFETLGSFFDRLQRFVTLKGDQIDVDGRLLRIESIDLSAGETGWPGISASINASSYIVPAASGLGDSAAAPATTAAPTGTAASTTSTAVSNG